jgi:hypothetical protein
LILPHSKIVIVQALTARRENMTTSGGETQHIRLAYGCVGHPNSALLSLLVSKPHARLGCPPSAHTERDALACAYRTDISP